MLTVQTSNSTTNPFYEILGELSKDAWIPVTLSYLNKIAKLINVNGTLVNTYGETFQVLEFLRDRGAVELEMLDGSANMYKIKRGY